MQITFNLEQAQVYIPSGRLMNLKHRLNWDDIELTSSDCTDIQNYIKNINFTVNTDFTKRLENNTANFMTQYSYDQRRIEMYRSYTQKSLDYDIYIDINLPKCVVVPDKLTLDIGISLEDNADILTKKKKLAQLKLVNSMN